MLENLYCYLLIEGLFFVGLNLHLLISVLMLEIKTATPFRRTLFSWVNCVCCASDIAMRRYMGKVFCLRQRSSLGLAVAVQGRLSTQSWWLRELTFRCRSMSGKDVGRWHQVLAIPVFLVRNYAHTLPHFVVIENRITQILHLTFSCEMSSIWIFLSLPIQVWYSLPRVGSAVQSLQGWVRGQEISRCLR